ncbi:MAG: competence/damage-inducible protein A [Sorangiineae bacterium]|nr:competence/damage-inducible protein A [Polyangiaceae bacterium]MEB2322374.1 competence/damage-inducible protein A [Sorangiineae bacterium]
MSVAILSVGTELTRGEIVNTNASWLGEALTEAGLEVTAQETVPDDVSRIVETLRRLGGAHRLIVCTGGLGPTTDDLTSAAVAQLLEAPLERDPTSLEVIRARMARLGRAVAASNEKQADFPRGARVLPNARGTAPGFAVHIGVAEAFFMPGVPREMRAMYREHVLPSAAALVTERSFQVRLQTFGMTESAVNDALAGVEAEHGVTVGYRVHFPEIEVKFLARAASPEAARQRARGAADAARSRLGADVVFGEGDATLSEAVGALLAERGLRLGLAESCTGGLVSALVTERSGASAYFAGGVVSYANQVKEAVLGVPAELLREHGAVSAEVACRMAEGARAVLGVEVALALTGVAGPTGGTDEKPVGLVHYAVATPERTTARQLFWPGSRGQVQRVAAFSGLALVRQVLLHGREP